MELERGLGPLSVDRLYHAVPKSQALFNCLAERGENLGAATSGLLRLLDQYGTK